MGLYPKLLLIATISVCNWHPGLTQISDYKGFKYPDIRSKSNATNICELHRSIDAVPIQWKDNPFKRTNSQEHDPLYYVMSKTTFRHHAYYMITGTVRPYSSATDLDFCLYMYPFWDAEIPHLNLIAYSKLSTEVLCKPVGDHHGHLSCVAENGSTFKQFMTKTDGKSYMVWVYCWEDGITTWIVLSKYTTLDPHTKWEILYHVRSLGFQPADRRETDYDKHCYRKDRTFEDIKDEIIYPAREGKRQNKEQFSNQ